MKKFILLLPLVTCMAISSVHAANTPDVLKQYYGKYNSKLQCYTHTEANSDLPFCMKIISQKEITTPKSTLLYVITKGDTFDPKTNEIVSYHVSYGINGMLVFEKQANSYKLLASDKSMALSSFGQGVEKWSFHQFAPNVWGALSESGDAHYGVSGSRFNILTPYNNKIVQSSIGNSYSDSNAGMKDCEKHPSQCTDLTASIKIDKSRTINGFYPLLMNVDGNDGKTRFKNKVYNIVYTPQKGYVEPKNYPLGNKDY